MRKRIITFLKNWTLPVSMLCGALAYAIGAALPLPAEAKADILAIVEVVQPVMLFVMLFVAFCKVNPSDLRPHLWHAWLLLVQSVTFGAFTFMLWLYPETEWRVIIEGAMLLLLCPTATACAVVTQKLGGDSATTTSYTIMVNLLIAVLVPLLLPIAHPSEGVSFLPAFLIIIKKVFPILMFPLFLAWVVRLWLPRLHARIVATKDFAFYLWVVALAIAIAVACKALPHNREGLWQVGGIAIATILVCAFNFAVGKKIGSHYGMRTEAGQALGQKNTVIVIWMGYTFLDPITAVAGGFYSIWHNVVNSYQLYHYRQKQDSKHESD